MPKYTEQQREMMIEEIEDHLMEKVHTMVKDPLTPHDTAMLIKALAKWKMVEEMSEAEEAHHSKKGY